MTEPYSTAATRLRSRSSKRSVRLRSSLRIGWTLLCCTVVLLSGCRTYHNLPETIGNDTTLIDSIMHEVDQGAPTHSANVIAQTMTQAPITLRTPEAFDQASFRELSLEEAIATALTNSDVLRDLGATVLRSPETTQGNNTRALAQMDPQFGIEAALSAYDTQFYAFGKFQNNDRRFNNRFFGGGSTAFKQDTHDYVLQLTKRSATGAQFAVRSVVDYDANNATGNLTPSAWQAQLHAEARQPLLQGGGLTFNRIAGPGARPGAYNGVLIAKVNNDITNAKFEQNVRDYVSNVVNAYWDLYFSYRDLDAKRDSYERSRTTWKSYDAQKSSNRKTGAAEALAREQYYRFEADLHDAIAGKMVQRTQVNNASSGGTFAGVGGVQAAERRLRLLIGMPISDGMILRPMDEPSTAPLIFDWQSIAAEAIRLRAELQQQRLLVKRREMELLAAKNFLMPSLDLVSIYRVRGLDRNLAGPDSAFGELGSFDFQEYEASLELKLPIGFRQGHLAVRHASLQLERDRSVLREQERKILHDLTAAVAESDRAYVQMRTSLNRYLAASDALATLEAGREAGMPVNLEQLLDSQRRVSDSQTRYFHSLVEYTIASKNVQFEKGTLLETTNLFIAGGGGNTNFAMPFVTPVPPSKETSDTDTGMSTGTAEDLNDSADAEEPPTFQDDEEPGREPASSANSDDVFDLDFRKDKITQPGNLSPEPAERLELPQPVREASFQMLPTSNLPSSLVVPAGALEQVSLEWLNEF